MIGTVILDLLREARLDERAFVESLDASEREAAGTPERWSAKDHVAHIAFWREQLARRLRAVLDHEPQPDLEDWESLNPRVFEEHRHTAWRNVLDHAERAYAAHTALIERLTDEDLGSFDRFDWLPDGQPLFVAVMGSSYEHAQVHLAQFHLERGDVVQARRICERWTARVVEARAPDAMKGVALYNLACFQATHDELERAGANLERALALYPGPRLREFSLTDPDLVALRDRST